MRIRGSACRYDEQRGQLHDAAHVHAARTSPPAASIEVKNEVHRRRRPVVRHRAAEVRPGRRGVRQLRPRLRPAPTAPARRASTMKPSAEAIGGIKLYLARNSFFEVGGGWTGLGRLRRGRRRAPFVGFIFEPSIGDRDGDGYKDDVDQCPDDPEDFDDFEDEDGCPEPDNDKDGILDDRRQVPERSRDQERLPGRGRLPRRHRRRPRRRRHPRRRRQVPRRSRGQGRLRGRGRLPRSGQRQGRHPRRRRPVPERPRGQGRLRGRGRLPRSGQRQGPDPRRQRQVPERARDLQRLRGRGRLPRQGPGHRAQGQDRDPRQDLLRDRQGDIKPELVPAPRCGRRDDQGQPADRS